MKIIRISICLIVAGYIITAGLISLTTYDSVDEYSIDYWAERLVQYNFNPIKALKMEPRWEQRFGYLGFIRSAHFVYNRSLKEIAAGETYYITPMISFVPLYYHAVFKLILGKYSYVLTNTILLLMGIGLPFWFCRRQSTGPSPWGLTAVLVLLTPALAINITHVMSDAVGFFGISLFCCTLFCQSNSRIWRIARWPLMIIGVLSMSFYNPLGLVLLPWGLALMLLMQNVRWSVKIGVCLIISLCTLSLAQVSKSIYSSTWMMGYRNPINQFLPRNLYFDDAEFDKLQIPKAIRDEFTKMNFISMSQAEQWLKSQGGNESIKKYESAIRALVSEKLRRDAKTEGVLRNRPTLFQNICYGIPALLICFPLMLFLLWGIARDLWSEWKAQRKTGLRNLLLGRFAWKSIYVSAFVFYFIFYSYYGHYASLWSYMSLANSTFRYFIGPFICLIWYVCAQGIDINIRKLFVPILLIELFVLLFFPRNLLERTAVRFYAAALQDELEKTIPANTVLVGAVKHDKYFHFDKIPSYSFTLHQHDFRFQCCFEEYSQLLGSFPDVIASIYRNEYVPIVIFPDRNIFNGKTEDNPYSNLQLQVIRRIDMKERMGWVGRFLPEDKRVVVLARVLECP